MTVPVSDALRGFPCSLLTVAGSHVRDRCQNEGQEQQCFGHDCNLKESHDTLFSKSVSSFQMAECLELLSHDY